MEHFDRHDEARAHADEHGGTVVRDRLWAVRPPGPPAESALKQRWVEFAVEQGWDRQEAEDATKDDLVAALG